MQRQVINIPAVTKAFLNPDRVSMPDIDLDISKERRGEIIQYVIDTYGRENVAQIGTYTTLSCKNALKKMFTAFGVPFAKANKFTALIPDGEITIEEALEIPAVKEVYEKDREIRQAVDVAKLIEGKPANTGVHAAGVIISSRPLTDYVALRVDGEGNLITEYDMDELESLGLLKMDFLGIRTLDVVHDTIRNVRTNQGIDLDMYSIPLDDKKTFKFYSKAEFMGGTFQTESQLFRRYLRQLKPETFEDIIDVLALVRPGPLDAKAPSGDGNMVDEFIRRRHGESPVEYIHPMLEETLKNTYGIIVYQEQVMRISRDMAGFTPGESDDLRRVIGRKIVSQMPIQKDKFITGSEKNNVSREIVETLWGQIETFGHYGL